MVRGRPGQVQGDHDDQQHHDHRDGDDGPGAGPPAGRQIEVLIGFTPDDYNNGVTLRVKLTKAGLPPYVAMLNPKQLMPGLGFFNYPIGYASFKVTVMVEVLTPSAVTEVGLAETLELAAVGVPGVNVTLAV